MARDGFDGLSKMRPGAEKRPEAKRPEAPKVPTEGEKVHTVHEHGDGTMHTEMADGTKTEHLDHLHMMAHMGHHMTGGDAHHVTHHDGMSYHSHGVDESGQHAETQDHNTAEEAKDALGNFFDEEAQEPAHQHGEAEEDDAPVMGGM